MSEIRICKYCGMELSEGIPHGLRECHLRAVARIAELEAERDQAKAAITRLRDYLYDYTNLRISVRQEDRWWALVDKFDELTKELQP